jgi:putative membrane protein
VFTGMTGNVGRFLLISCALLFASSYFPARIPMADNPIISSGFVIAMALPSCYYLFGWLGAPRAGSVMLLLGALSVLVEAFAVKTGFPYGGFIYSDALGYKVLGLVPWTVAFAYLPLLLGSAALASRLLGSERLRFALGSSALLLAVDLVVDPAAVAGGLWAYSGAGAYYGVPLANFMGWLLTSFVYSNILYAIAGAKMEEDGSIPVEVSASLLMALSFWTGFLAWRAMIVPAAIGVSMIAFGGHLFHRS